MKMLYKILIVVLILTGISQLTAQQQKPGVPVNFNASFEHTSAGYAIKFTWETNPNGIVPNIYNIYYTDNNANKIILLAQVKHLDNQKEYKYLHYLQENSLNSYSFTITAGAYLNGTIIESDYSKFITLTNGNPKKLYFASKPITESKLGSKYYYQMKVQSTLRCEYKFELLTAPEGMKLEANNLIWVPEKAGEYKVSVKVSYTDCDDDAHDIQNFAIKVIDGQHNELFVKIIMEDVVNMKLGTTMTLKLFAESNANCPVIFDFPNGLPEGFKFGGANTANIIVASPTRAGEYILAIRAVLSCDKNITDMKKVIFRVEGENHEPKHCAWIKGTVVTEDNVVVKEGIVNALKLDRNSKNEAPLYKAKIADGNFELNVPEGNYALDISGAGFYAEWYEDAEFVTDATRITLACDETFTANAVVKALPVPKHFTVSGKVYNKETNEPVWAQIEFINSESMFNSSSKQENARFFTKTDDNGNYSIKLPDNFSYIAVAVSAMSSIQFDIVYYKDSHNPMEAEILKLIDNLENIDFGLTPVKHKNAGFTGRVVNKNNEPLNAKLIAYSTKSLSQNQNDVRSSYLAETNEEGYYRFDKMVPGEYIVQSIPASRDYVPGYYNKNDFVVLKWKESAVISVGEVMIDMLFDFKHNLREEIGLVQIGGKIINKGGIIATKGNETQSGVPVAGAYVYVLNENGAVCDFVFSNNEGSFEMKEADEGTLRIIADKVGMETYEGVIETDYNEKSNVQLEFAMEEAVVSVDDAFVSSNGIITFPMPVQNVLNIKFNSDFVYQTEVNIYNILGSNIITEQVNLIKGENNVSLNLSNLANGSYIISINTGNTVLKKSIHVIR